MALGSPAGFVHRHSDVPQEKIWLTRCSLCYIEVNRNCFHTLNITHINNSYVRILSGGFLIGIFLFLSMSFSDIVWPRSYITKPIVVAPLHHCEVVIKVVTWLVALALPTNSFLFFLRVRAVFLQSPYIVWAFFALWLTTFASITAPFSFQAIQLGPTRWCINSVVREYSAVTFVTIFVFDTSVFFTISFKITIHGMAHDLRSWVNVFSTGSGVGYMSRALLRTGQLYYL